MRLRDGVSVRETVLLREYLCDGLVSGFGAIEEEGTHHCEKMLITFAEWQTAGDDEEAWHSC